MTRDNDRNTKVTVELNESSIEALDRFVEHPDRNAESPISRSEALTRIANAWLVDNGYLSPADAEHIADEDEERLIERAQADLE